MKENLPNNEKESIAEDLGDEEGQNVRAFDALLRSMIQIDLNTNQKSCEKKTIECLSESTTKDLKKKL